MNPVGRFLIIENRCTFDWLKEKCFIIGSMDNLLNIWKTKRNFKPIRITPPVSQISLAATGILPLPQSDSYRVRKCCRCFPSTSTLHDLNKPHEGPLHHFFHPVTWIWIRFPWVYLFSGSLVPSGILAPSVWVLLFFYQAALGVMLRRDKMYFEWASLLHIT